MTVLYAEEEAPHGIRTTVPITTSSAATALVSLTASMVTDLEPLFPTGLNKEMLKQGAALVTKNGERDVLGAIDRLARSWWMIWSRH